jgi:hypothetical protein
MDDRRSSASVRGWDGDDDGAAYAGGESMDATDDDDDGDGDEQVGEESAPPPDSFSASMCRRPHRRRGRIRRGIHGTPSSSPFPDALSDIGKLF